LKLVVNEIERKNGRRSSAPQDAGQGVVPAVNANELEEVEGTPLTHDPRALIAVRRANKDRV